MKKLFAWAVIALPILAACDSGEKINNSEEGGGSQVEVTMKNIVGEWYLNLTGEGDVTEETLTFNNDGSYVSEVTLYRINDGNKEISSQNRTEGTFKLEGSILIGNVTKSQHRYTRWVDGVNQGLSDWQNNGAYESFDSVQVSLLRDGGVLVLETEYKISDQVSESYAAFYFKKGSSLPSDNSEIQGTWYWFSWEGDRSAVRVAVKFDGDNIDLIVVPWSQRFICKYKYEDGIVSSDGEVTFRTLWHENGANEMNEEDPFASDWLPTYDPEQYTGNLTDGFSFPFIVSGNKAYSNFVGLTPIYIKQ